MLIKQSRGWEIPEALATPEDYFLNRRALLAGGASIALGAALAGSNPARAVGSGHPTADLYPVKRNPRFKLDRALTPENINATYNNYYEFGSHKQISRAAQALKTDPWAIKIDGMVEKPMTIDASKLIRQMPLEERLYRHRCVEAWSMTIPWSGFPLAELVKMARPLSGARYIRMETFLDRKMARGQRASWYPWPYVEGVTMAEAMNDLAFMVTGAYGKPLHKQFGAPIRLHLPWKYGFKSIKSIVRISFTNKRPKSFWETIQAREYGFWANVNPKVPHPRWSQASERVLGTNKRVPTLIYNGYGKWVAGLYKGIKGEHLFM